MKPFVTSMKHKEKFKSQLVLKVEVYKLDVTHPLHGVRIDNTEMVVLIVNKAQHLSSFSLYL